MQGIMGRTKLKESLREEKVGCYLPELAQFFQAKRGKNFVAR